MTQLLEEKRIHLSNFAQFEKQSNGKGYHRVERATGSFSRTLTLPEGIDADGIEASFDRGVLEVRVPKPEERKPRKVAISVGDGAEAKTIEGSESKS